MNLISRLLSIEVPENMTLQSAEVSFRGGPPVWLGVLIFLLFGAVIVYLYVLEKAKVGWVRRSIMAGLRLALLALVLLLLFRPVLLSEFQGERPRGILLLTDNTQSMTLQDRRLTEADKLRVSIAEGLTPLDTKVTDAKSLASIPPQTSEDPKRADVVRAILKNPELKLLERLQERGPLRPFMFGHREHGVQLDSKTSLSAALLKSLQPTETETALADALHDLLQRRDADVPGAVVLISDGLDNASKYTLEEAAQECARLKVPLHIYGVGTAEGGNLQLKEVGVPDTVFFDDVVSIPIRWRAQGFKKGTVEIKLTLGGRLVAKKELPVQLGEDLREVLEFTPEKEKDKADELPLIATIRLKENDTFKDTFEQAVRVVDSKIKILFVENSPRFEYKFLQPTLLRDRRIDIEFLLVNADPKVLNSGPPFIPSFPATREKFFDAKYNLIILGDVPASYFGKERLEWIRDFVQNRGGLIVIAGRQNMPSAYVGSPLEEVLPVEFQSAKFPIDSDRRTQEFPVDLTDAGKRSAMLALADTAEENLKVWEHLPGFFWNYPVEKLRPGATVLSVNPRAKLDVDGKQKMPLMVTQFYGKGQVLFLSSDETWRWRYNVQDKHYARFWGQVIYQMGLPHLLGDHARRVQMALEHSKAVLGQEGSVFVRMLDKDFNPRKDEQVEAILEHLDAKAGQERTQKVMLQSVPGRPGEYRSLLMHDKPGRYALRVNNPDPVRFFFQVELPPRHELEESGMAETALRKMAALTTEAAAIDYARQTLQRLAGSRWVVRERPTVTVSGNKLEPQLAVLLAGADDNPKGEDLVLAIDFSTTVKADTFAAAKIPQYMTVNLAEGKVETFSEPGATGVYQKTKTFFKGEKAPVVLGGRSVGDVAVDDLFVGGGFYREEDLRRLPDNIKPRYTGFVRRQELVLWNPLALFIFVGLITAEWLVRKFSNLS